MTMTFTLTRWTASRSARATCAFTRGGTSATSSTSSPRRWPSSNTIPTLTPKTNPNPNPKPTPNPNPKPNPNSKPNPNTDQVAVFQYHPEVAAEIDSLFARTAPQLRAELLRSCKPTLSLVQTVSTLPSAFPRELNTCGPMSRPQPVRPASAANAAGWPRLAVAWGSLRRDLALRGASGVPAGRRLSQLV